MPDYGRCIDLINQAEGSFEERLSCASSGMWGNRPLYDFRDSYGGIPTPWVPQETREMFTFPEPRSIGMRRCNSGCGCGGGGVAGGAGGSGAGSPGSMLTTHAGAGLAGSSIGFNVQFSGLLLFILVMVAIFKRRG